MKGEKFFMNSRIFIFAFMFLFAINFVIADSTPIVEIVSPDKTITAVAQDSNATTACTGDPDVLIGNGTCMPVATISLGSSESDPIWSANLTNMIVACGGTDKVTGIYGNGSFICGADASGAGGGQGNWSGNLTVGISGTIQPLTNNSFSVGANVLQWVKGWFVDLFSNAGLIRRLESDTINATTEIYINNNPIKLWLYNQSENIDWTDLSNIPTFTTFNGTEFTDAFNLNVTDNILKLSQFNITGLPTCGANEHLDYNGSTIECTADSGSSTMNYTNLILTNRSVGAGLNITLSDGGWFRGLFNWTTSQIWWLQFNGASLTFNDSLMNDTVEQITASTTYYPTNVSTLAGTYVSGNNTDLWAAKEDFNYTVTEDAGASPLTITINFTGVEDFNSIVMREWYAGGVGHEIAIGLWDYGDNSYEEEYGNIVDMEDFAFSSIPVYDSSDHIQNTNVSLRFRHIQNGIASHVFYLDYVVLVEGFTTITTSEHDATTSRNEIGNHPQYLDHAASRNVTGNLELDLGINLTLGAGSFYKGILNNVTLLTWANLTNLPTFTTFNATDFTEAFNTNVTDNILKSSQFNITGIPTCGAGQHLDYNGTTIECTVDSGGVESDPVWNGNYSSGVSFDWLVYTTNTYNLGAVYSQWKDLYINGTIYIDGVGVNVWFYNQSLNVPDNSLQLSWANLTDLPTFTTFNGTDFTTAFNLNVTDNILKLSQFNITGIPMCGPGEHLDYNGTTIECTADVAGGGAGQGNWTGNLTVGISGNIFPLTNDTFTIGTNVLLWAKSWLNDTFSHSGLIQRLEAYTINATTEIYIANNPINLWLYNMSLNVPDNSLKLDWANLTSIPSFTTFNASDFHSAFDTNISARTFSDFNFTDFQDSFDLNASTYLQNFSNVNLTGITALSLNIGNATGAGVGDIHYSTQLKHGGVESVDATISAYFKTIGTSPNHGIRIEEASGAESWFFGVNNTGGLEFYDSNDATPDISFRDGSGTAKFKGGLNLGTATGAGVGDIEMSGTLNLVTNLTTTQAIASLSDSSGWLMTVSNDADTGIRYSETFDAFQMMWDNDEIFRFDLNAEELVFPDDHKAEFGDSSDAQIYYDSGTSRLVIQVT